MIMIKDLPWGLTVFIGPYGYGCSMAVGTRYHEYIVADQSLVPGKYICRQIRTGYIALVNLISQWLKC